MEIIQLPFDLTNKTDPLLQLHDYQTSSSSLKSKISLTYHTISFLQNGQKEVITDFESTQIRPDQFLIIKAGNCLMSETISKQQNYSSMLLFFSNKILIDFFSQRSFQVQKAIHPKQYFVGEYDTYTQHFVSSLKQISQLDAMHKQQLLQIKFEEIMTYLIQIKEVDFVYSLIQEQNPKTNHFIHVIEQNKLNNLTIQELSFLCNMSISSFKREFKKHFDDSPSKWFKEKRLEHAALLLSTQTKRPIDVYGEVGFENLSGFTQAFKKKYSLTPKQFQLEKRTF